MAAFLYVLTKLGKDYPYETGIFITIYSFNCYIGNRKIYKKINIRYSDNELNEDIF